MSSTSSAAEAGFQIRGADLDSDVADLEHLGGMNPAASSAADLPAHLAEDVR